MPRTLTITSDNAHENYGEPIRVVAELRDAGGVVESTACGPVFCRFATSPAGSAPGGTLVRYMTNGVVTFDDLTVDKVGAATIEVEVEEESAFVERPVTWRVETGNTFTSPLVGRWVGVKEPSVGATVWLQCTASASGLFDLTEVAGHPGARAILTKPIASLEFRQVAATFTGTPTPGLLGTLVSTLARVNRSRGWWAWWAGTTNPVPGLDHVGSLFCFRATMPKIDLVTGNAPLTDNLGAGTWTAGIGWSYSAGTTTATFPASAALRAGCFSDGATWHALVDYPTVTPSNPVFAICVTGPTLSENEADNFLGSLGLSTARAPRFFYEGVAAVNHDMDAPVDAAGWSQQRVLMSCRLVQNGGGAGIWRFNHYKNGVLVGFVDSPNVPVGGENAVVFVRGNPTATNIWPASVAVAEVSIRVAPESDILVQAQRCGVAP